MPKSDEVFLEQVSEMLEKEQELQRFLAFIRMLDKKEKIAEKMLILAQEEYRRACLSGEEKKVKEKAEKVMQTYKTIYGLSKQKIQVCRQCTTHLSFLSSQLIRLKQIRAATQVPLQKRPSYASIYSYQSQEPEISTNKSRIKKRKQQGHNYQTFDKKSKLEQTEQISQLEIVVAEGSEIVNQE